MPDIYLRIIRTRVTIVEGASPVGTVIAADHTAVVDTDVAAPPPGNSPA